MHNSDTTPAKKNTLNVDISAISWPSLLQITKQSATSFVKSPIQFVIAALILGVLVFIGNLSTHYFFIKGHTLASLIMIISGILTWIFCVGFMQVTEDINHNKKPSFTRFFSGFRHSLSLVITLVICMPIIYVSFSIVNHLELLELVQRTLNHSYYDDLGFALLALVLALVIMIPAIITPLYATYIMKENNALNGSVNEFSFLISAYKAFFKNPLKLTVFWTAFILLASALYSISFLFFLVIFPFFFSLCYFSSEKLFKLVKAS